MNTPTHSTPEGAAALLPEVFAERLADGWRFAYEPSTKYVGLNHPRGGKQSVVRVEYGAYADQIGEAIAALFNSAAVPAPAAAGDAMRNAVAEMRKYAAELRRDGMAVHANTYEHCAAMVEAAAAPAAGGEEVVGIMCDAGGCRPLTSVMAEALFAQADAKRTDRERAMPTEADAIRLMFEAWLRLKELGWNEAIYCPKDGSAFDAIEAGSTGIHACHYSGEWPKGSWWVASSDGDLYPSRPILWRAARKESP